MSPVKIHGIHGLGDHRGSQWREQWQGAISPHLPLGTQPVFTFTTYDDVFEETDISPWEATKALGKLVGSGVASGVAGAADAVSGFFGLRRRGLFGGVTEKLRWTAGYVVAWVEDAEFKRRTRERVLEDLKRDQPRIWLAHSLGSLISYDAFSSVQAREDAQVRAILEKMTFVTFGSQIGNPFVKRNLTPGRIEMLPVGRWVHLFNEEDDVFTSEIRLPAEPKFEQVTTYFDISGMADHSAPEYLGHPGTHERLWQLLRHEGTPAARALTARGVSRGVSKKRSRKPRRRALLIGINDYPEKEDRLEGCVNDTFLVSSVLQECGFEAADIRLCLDRRATASGILSRLDWLLSDPRPEDELVFYYSGHGAQLPSYGEGDKVDRMDETLVPYDFDWSPERSITDDQIHHLYSQLPYDTTFAMIFDCCHSGGIHRDGARRAKGLTPPDDIRHRALRWDSRSGMWVSRDLAPINKEFTDEDDVQRQFCGRDGSTYRLGRAMPLRGLSQVEYQRLKGEGESAKWKREGKGKGNGKAKGKATRSKKGEGPQGGASTAPPVGPYLPLILEACAEDQFAYEYRHGVTSYGAFSFTLASILRVRKKMSFRQLVEEASAQLAEQGYDQTPQLLGPKSVVESTVPWLL